MLYVWGKIKTLVGTKVDKVEGKGLSTNDYTTTDKNKLSNIASGAQVNVIESIKVNNAAQTVTSKSVNITVPTNLSDLTNDGNYVSDANYVHTDSNFTADEKTKLAGIATGATKVTVDTTLSSTSTNAIQNKAVNTALGNKVDKVSGKGLSTNDYTTDEKNKLSGIASGAEVNVITGIKRNGTALTPTDKVIDISVPTNNNQLTNGAGYQTASQVTTAINNALKDMTGIKFQKVSVLPTTGVVGTIYLVPSATTSSTNSYDEYFWNADDTKFEFFGTTEVDLSGYQLTADLKEITNGEIDTICT